MARALCDGVAVDYGRLSPPDWYEGVARSVAARCDGRPWIAVLHSGGGSLAPAIAAASADLAGFIFVDAVLPHPGKSWIETVPGDRPWRGFCRPGTHGSAPTRRRG